MEYCLHLPRLLYQEMLDQAQAELPNECCGLLAGNVLPVSGPAQHVIAKVLRRYPLVNELASPVEYLSEPKSMFHAIRAIDRLGLEILAVYHSHPMSDPVPSRTDCERNYWPQLMSLIVSLKDGQPRMAGWWLAAEDYREAEWKLVD